MLSLVQHMPAWSVFFFAVAAVCAVVCAGAYGRDVWRLRRNVRAREAERTLERDARRITNFMEAA